MSDRESAATHTTIGTWSAVVARTLHTHYRLDPEPLFAELDIDYERRHDPEYRVPVVKMTQLWQRAIALTGDTAIGLEVARHVSPTTFHALGYAVIASDDVMSMLTRLQSYSAIVSDVAQCHLMMDGELAWLEFRLQPDAPDVSDAAVEAFMASMVFIFSQYLHLVPGLLRVRLRRTETEHLSRYESFFQAEVEMGARHFGLAASASRLLSHLPTANPAIAAANDAVLTAWFKDYFTSPLQRDVMQLIQDMLPDVAKLDDIAKALHVSPRNLQRRLEAEDLSFQALRDDVRGRVARQRLSQPGASIQVIADELGFANPSAFSRAFKRWFDETPERYRTRQSQR